MLYEKQFLMQNFKDGSEGMSEQQFLKTKTRELLDLLISGDRGKQMFRHFGPYWENLYGIFQKYCNTELVEYEGIAGPFDTFNDEVKSAYDYGSDILNFMGALQYYMERITGMNLPEKPHILEVDGKEMAYMPNQYVDDQYLGRE